MSKRAIQPPAEHFFERTPWNNRWFLFAMALLVSCFDFLAGPVILFPIFFTVPVALMAWNCGLRTALVLGSILCVIRFCIQYFVWGISGPLSVLILNAILRLAVLLFITFLVGKLSQQTQALRARVRTLEGILPMCAFCKDIRDEAGNWQEMEDYITARTEARFSHDFCPKCTTKHYGGLLDECPANQASALP